MNFNYFQAAKQICYYVKVFAVTSFRYKIRQKASSFTGSSLGILMWTRSGRWKWKLSFGVCDPSLAGNISPAGAVDDGAKVNQWFVWIRRVPVAKLRIVRLFCDCVGFRYDHRVWKGNHFPRQLHQLVKYGRSLLEDRLEGGTIEGRGTLESMAYLKGRWYL